MLCCVPSAKPACIRNCRKRALCCGGSCTAAPNSRVRQYNCHTNDYFPSSRPPACISPLPSPTLMSPIIRHLRQFLILGLSLLLPSAAGLAADWPQYRGPDQTGASSEKVDLGWPAEGPKLLWKVPTRNGFMLVCRLRRQGVYTGQSPDRRRRAGGLRWRWTPPTVTSCGRPTSTPATTIPAATRGPGTTTAATAPAPRPR